MTPTALTPIVFTGRTPSAFLLSATSSSCRPLLLCTHHHLAMHRQPHLLLCSLWQFHSLFLHQLQYCRHYRRHYPLYPHDPVPHHQLQHHFHLPLRHLLFHHLRLLQLLLIGRREWPDPPNLPSPCASPRTSQSRRICFGKLRLGKEP